MKVQLHIDLDVNVPRWLRRAMLLGAPVAAMAIAGTVLGKPEAFAANEKLSASKMNANFADLDARSATEWQSYACTVADGATGSTIGGETSGCFFRHVGNTIEVTVHTTFTQLPLAGTLTWPLPPNMQIDPTHQPSDADGDRNILGFAALDGSTPAKVCFVRAYAASLTNLSIQCHGESSSVNGSAITSIGTSIRLTYSVPVVPS